MGGHGIAILLESERDASRRIRRVDYLVSAPNIYPISNAGLGRRRYEASCQIGCGRHSIPVLRCVRPDKAAKGLLIIEVASQKRALKKCRLNCFKKRSDL